MAKLKHSQKADAVGNLYRAALFLAQNNQGQALVMLEQASQRLTQEELGKTADLLNDSSSKLTSSQEEKYWAEMILDQYKKLSREYF